MEVKKVFRCYIEPVLLYRSESWTVSEKLFGGCRHVVFQKSDNAWTYRRCNEDVLIETNSQRELFARIRRQSRFFGHVMRRGKLEYVVSTGRLEWKRGGGRSRAAEHIPSSYPY
ncbi:hypothetical protein BsWGS_04770 [Bradybaena similaris]